MTETVPADIAAAIKALEGRYEALLDDQGAMFWHDDAELAAARADLNAVILHHLRDAAEMKAALERIEQGV